MQYAPLTNFLCIAGISSGVVAAASLISNKPALKPKLTKGKNIQ